MLDKKRILSKIGELDSYMAELEEIAPETFEEYKASYEKKRACERILQISIETVIDISQLLFRGMRLGVPADEDNIFEGLKRKGAFNDSMADTLHEMKGFRNILVHRYGKIDDVIVFRAIKQNLDDFEKFKNCVLEILNKK